MTRFGAERPAAGTQFRALESCLMDPSHLDELVRLEDSYWWHVAKRQLVCGLLKKHFPAPGRLVEGGIGSARNLLEFRDAGYDVTGFDIMNESVQHGIGRGIEDCRVHDLEQPWPLEEESVRAVVLLDVLEHVENPVRVLQHVKHVLRPDGGIVFTVPAYPWLFSEWDKQLGHYRRYTSKVMREQVRAAGLKIEWLNHWNAFTLPAAVAVRGVEKMRPARQQPDFPAVSPFVNRLLLNAAGAERWLMVKLGIPVGLSLVGVIRK